MEIDREKLKQLVNALPDDEVILSRLCSQMEKLLEEAALRAEWFRLEGNQ